MINFQDYVETVKSSIKEYLPEEFAGAEVDIHETKKLNESYTALSVRKPEQVVTPSINLDAFFERYNGSPVQFNQDMMTMAQLVQSEPDNLNLDVLTNYDQAKDQLFIRVSSLEQNKDRIEEVPHMIKEDLLITYHIAAEMGEDGMASTIINNLMMAKFQVSPEQLHADALESSQKLLPAQIRSMDEVIRPMMRTDMISSGMSPEEAEEALDQMLDNSVNPMMVVSNDRTLNGAAVLFYPNVMEQISERLNGDFFILPSSVHETLVLPDNGEFQVEDLKDMVQEVNSSQVEPEERLTDEVYHFDSKDHVFEKAETFVNRQKAKEKAVEKDAAKKVDANKELHKEPTKPKRRVAEMTM